jgi:hypothetical protein
MMRMRAYLCLTVANALCSASTAVTVSSVRYTSSSTGSATSVTAVCAAAVTSKAPATAWLDAAVGAAAVATGATVCYGLLITIHQINVSATCVLPRPN